jgi:hypothetical protein
MKEVLEKFGISEVFAYLPSGGLLIASYLFWLPPPDVPKEGWQSFALSAFLVVLAYTLGLLVATWSTEGAAFYLFRLHVRPSVERAWWRALTEARKWPGTVFDGLVWLFHWLPPLPYSDLQIASEFPSRTGRIGLSQFLRTPWGSLTFYRTLVADAVSERDKSVLAEAETVHRHILFAEGVALAFLLLALQASARLVCHWALPEEALPRVPWPALVGLLVLGVGASFGLRMVAGRWWETEYTLTRVLYHSQMQAQMEQGEPLIEVVSLSQGPAGPPPEPPPGA